MAMGRSQMTKQVEGKLRGAKIKKVMKGLRKASKTHAAQAKTLKGVLNGRPKKRNRKNPKDTVRIKFATPADARATVSKVRKVNKPFARKIQILTVMEQRAKVMGKTGVVNIAKKAKESLRRTRKV
jgi:hypothetical protein